MKHWAILAMAALCSACTAPMLVSVDLVQQPVQGAIATYGVGISEIEVATLPYGGVAALPEACKAALDVYDAARDAHGPKAEEINRLNRRLEHLDNTLFFGRNAYYAALRAHDETANGRWGWRPLSEAEKASVVAELIAYETAAAAARTSADGVERAQIRVEERCPEEDVRLQLTRHVEASSELLFAAVLRGGVMSDDKITIATGANGLLTSVDASAADQTGAAVEKAGELIGRFSVTGGGAVYPPPPPSMLPPDKESLDRAAECGIAALPPKRRLEVLAGRLECVDGPAIYQLINELRFWPGSFGDLRPQAPPRPQRFSLDDLIEGVTYGEADLRAECAWPAETDGMIDAVYDGVVVATPLPCRLTATVDDGEVGRLAFVGLSTRALSVIPVERAMLVTNKTTLTLTNGAVSNAVVERPSVGAAVVGLPGRFIASLVKGVAAAFTDSTTIETARLNQINAEANRVRAETTLLQAQAMAPAWDVADTTYVQAESTVITKQAAYDAALVGGNPTTIASALAELRNAQAAANAAAASSGRALPYPALI
ncbi:MAG: hypothetical protein V4707_12630 [Pseudomonadota bacterium]